MKRSTLTFASIMVVLSLVAAACGGGDEESITVYSGRSEDLVGPVIESFVEETGIEVDVRYGDSAELATTITVEGDETPADVFFAQDPASLGLVADAGLFEALDPEVADLVDARFRDGQDRWVGTSGRIRVVVVNPDLVGDDELPSSVWDLTDPAWSGRLAIAPTNGSFLAFVSAMILDEGEDRTLEWLEAIAANDPVDFPGNSLIVEAVDLGEVDAGLVNHYYLLRREAELGSVTARNHFLTAGDAGSLVMPAGVGVLSSSEAATAFVEHLLSTETQSYFATETFEFPLIDGVEPAPGLPAIDEIDGPDIDLSDLAGVLERAVDLVAEAGLV